MERKFKRLADMIQSQYHSLNLSGEAVTFALQLDGGQPVIFGSGQPAFTMVLKGEEGIAALSTFDGTTILEAYMSGAIDISGNLREAFTLRDMLKDKHALRYLWCFVQPLVFGQVKSDKKWIARHYDYEQDFYMLFLDSEHRCYSQAIFESDDEGLESAMTRKLDFAVEAANLKPGMHVLDIGGGWGSFLQYAGRKGIRVTSLTISNESEKFMNDIIAGEGLDGRVVKQHLLEYSPGERFDAIVNLGVTEHLPNYRATLAKYQELLKPGGRVYLDASAARAKYQFHSFIYRYIYPGNCSPLCLHEYMTELSRTPFHLIAVHDDRHNYYLTTKRWAENLDRNREEVERRWGVAHYRKFQLYLWACVDVFLRDIMQAYRLVLEVPR